MPNKWPKIKLALSLYGIIFTAATIINSILALSAGHMYGAHGHIIMRAVIVLIVVLTVAITGTLNANKWLKYAIAYAVAVALALGSTWLNGQLFVELHTHAYRDMFISISLFFVPAIAIHAVLSHIKSRRQNAE